MLVSTCEKGLHIYTIENDSVTVHEHLKLQAQWVYGDA